jgi:hypothetical protein
MSKTFTSPQAKVIYDALRIVLSSAHVHEFRALGADRSGTVSGYFDGRHLPEMAEAAAEWSGDAEGCYLTLNPVNPDLIARACNRCRTWAKHTTSDTDIIGRRWLPLDFDSKRPAGISSTDAEHQVALERAEQCAAWLKGLAFSENSLILADSGNGAHVLARISLKNTSECTDLVRRCLEAVAFQFTGNGVDVDLKTFNAARIFKLYGTLACKGDSTKTRPHRLAKILQAPEKLVTAPRDLLENLAAMAPVEPKPVVTVSGCQFGNFNLSAWIAEHALPVSQEKEWKGGRAWILNPCPWNSDHCDRAAFVVQFASGAIAAGCHHNGCAGKNWDDLRNLYEPNRPQNLDLDAYRQAKCSPAIAREFHRARNARKK